MQPDETGRRVRTEGTGGIALGLLVLVPALLLATLLAEVVQYSRNVPALLDPPWALGKQLAAAPIMGAQEAASTRNLLHRNRLNLHAWHGFHELLLGRIFRPGRLRLRFRLADDAYLHLIVNRDADGFSGVRLSRNERFPSQFYRAHAEGGFRSRTRLSVGELGARWHVADLEFVDQELLLRIDGGRALHLPEPARERQVVGFRSGRAPVWIDDVEVRDAQGRIVEIVDFRNTRGGLRLVGRLAALFAAIALLVLGMGVLVGRPKEFGFGCFVAEATLLMLLALYLAFDFLEGSDRYPYGRSSHWMIAQGDEIELAERLRVALLARFPLAIPELPEGPPEPPRELAVFLETEPGLRRRAQNVRASCGRAGEQRRWTLVEQGPALAAARRSEPLASAVRILFLGTSQMWGEGATRPAERIGATAQRLLSARLGPSTPVCVVNASKRGSRSGPLLERYRGHLHALEPHVVVVNLSNNDRLVGFEARLEALVAAIRRPGALVLLVLESNSLEVSPDIRARHAVVRTVARRWGLPVIDLYGYLNSPAVYDSGILWWDRTHLTSYGQLEAARFITAGLRDAFGLHRISAVPASPGAE